MAVGRIYIAGETWEISGEVTDNFSPYDNTLEASRGGRIFANTSAAVKMLSIENIKHDQSEAAALEAFLTSCAAIQDKFSLTVEYDETCQGSRRTDYTGCLISGRPTRSVTGKTITGFEVGYEAKSESGANV